MEYPKLRELETSREMVEIFKGYNHNLRISDGEFFDMMNLASDYYPVLAPRGNRGVYTAAEAPGGLIGKDSLCYVDGTEFVVGETRVEMGLSEQVPKQLVSMGAYVIIMPDRKYINTMDLTDFGDIEASFNTGAESVAFCPCSISGESFADATVSDTTPKNPEDLALWLDTSTEPHSLKRYTGTTGTWVNVNTTYIKMTCAGIGKAFRQYDGISISGVLGSDTAGLNGSHIIWGCADDYLIMDGLIDKEYIQKGVPVMGGTSIGVLVDRKMPEMDFLIESENRLWGCRYGTAANGEMVNEIYASKLGDFRNWECFMNLSTDSYRASCGTDGPFTGAITHMGYPLFFKENYVHKVYGNYPANFQIQTTACRGVQKGSDRSLAIVNETLFYKSRGGVCAYDGSLPVEASYALGSIGYSEAVAGSHGNKYYISMKDDADIWHLFVYDTAKDMWHREDNLRADGFCSFRGEMYAIDHGSREIITMLGSGTRDTKRVKWMAQTGIIGTDMPDMKYVSRLVIRMSLAIGSRVHFRVQYDSMEAWEHICTIVGKNLRSFSVPIRPRRCDHLRLRIEGEGEARIYSITRTTEQGSDIS